MNNNIEYFFRKPVLVLMNISKEFNTTTILTKKIDITISHTAHIIKQLEDMDLLKTKKLTKERIITLTEKGKKVKNILLRLKEVMEE